MFHNEHALQCMCFLEKLHLHEALCKAVHIDVDLLHETVYYNKERYLKYLCHEFFLDTQRTFCAVSSVFHSIKVGESQ